MANQPFDSTIINPLERPLSSDMNALQSEAHRDLRDYLYRAYASSNGPDTLSTTAQTGFVGRSFAVEPTIPVGMAVYISPGIGFMVGAAASNVGGIAGLNDLSSYKPILLSATKTVSVPTAPGGGFCRRDLIEVRFNRKLTDATASDQYNSINGQFQNVILNKTMTFDLYGEAVQYITAGSPTPATGAIVYRVGAEVSYTSDDSFLAATVPSTDPDYVAIAVINVGPNAATITTNKINDLRQLICQNKVYELVGSATLGGADASASPTPIATQLSNVVLRVPPGMRAAITKANAAVDGNQYVLTVVGCPSATDIGGFFTTTMQNTVIPYLNYSRPVIAAIKSRAVNVVCDAAKAANLVSVHTTPTLPVAVGQVVHTITFTVGVVVANTTNIPVTSVDIAYITDVSDFTHNGSTTETVDTSFNIKVAV